MCVVLYIYIYIQSARRTFRCTKAHQCSSERTWIAIGTECSNRYLNGEQCLHTYVSLYNSSSVQLDMWNTRSNVSSKGPAYKTLKRDE